ncbi:MAG TPA: apolipoprotein N-acyltransferase [Gemmatimonadales bacterium]|nr:apolipoprotein N-acyltransferase [Gemmatimonadales bacterium]
MSPRRWLPDRRDLAAAATTAVLLFVAYPPYSLVLPAFVALVPLLWRLEDRLDPAAAAAGAAKLGFWAGVLANGLVLYWMIVALWHFTPLSAAGYLATILILGGWWSLLCWTTVWVRRRTGVPLWAVFPLLWTAMEWCIGHQGEVRFPWLGLGTSLSSVPVLVQWADLAGARGVTLWLAWVSAAAVVALRRRTWRPAAVAGASVVVALGYGVWRERTTVLRPVTTVGVIQPNVGFAEKRSLRDQDVLVQDLLRLTAKADSLPGVRLVAWPEAAAEGWFVEHPQWVQWIGDAARRARVPILAGALDAQFYPNGSYDAYNAAFFFDSTGSDASWPSYRKKYLVPIVERVPFVNPRWFGRLKWFGGFGHGDRFPVYRFAAGGFGVLICYESAFEDLPRLYRARGADFLVNITNDAWFGRTAAPYQHAAHLVMRAIETRIGVARAANTGISEFVDPLGYTHLRTPLDARRIEADTVWTTSGRTLYVRWGDWVGVLALVGTGALVVGGLMRRRAQQ